MVCELLAEGIELRRTDALEGHDEIFAPLDLCAHEAARCHAEWRGVGTKYDPRTLSFSTTLTQWTMHVPWNASNHATH